MFKVSDTYLSTVRNGGEQAVVCDAYRDGFILPGGRDLRIASGSVTDNSEPGVRRQLDIELVSVPGLFDLLAPIGTQLQVRSVLRFPNGSNETVPMGVFEVDAEKIGDGPDGTLTVQASDKWVRIQRARFLLPYASNPALTIVQQITALIRRALGSSEPVKVTATNTDLVGSVVWDRDADKAIIELAKSIGAWVYFDRNGLATIADLPTGAATPVWTVDASSAGIMLSSERSRDRSKTYNAVVVNSEKVDGSPLFEPQIVSDDDSASPTWIGGPFGQVPYFYSSPLLQNAAQAQRAGLTILDRVKGLNAQLRLSAVRNHALDALDPITVQLPRERRDIPRPVEVHASDKIVHPLTPEGVQSIDTRSTRADEV